MKALLIVMVLTTNGKHLELSSSTAAEMSSMEVCRLAEGLVLQDLTSQVGVEGEIKTDCKILSAQVGQKF
ncbi:hypothetical protein [Sinorhizobium meliloti]|uniref:hypothetical protein n=1 Tax=Rhizobium meliloti TaxID=382 RepID=UPI001295EFEF|nr:hypothetical protein [Sinorhizobium meliloti]MDW9491744.1 hypothetical protein [Sinorhizobium meliloti]MQV03010.1 hypothetical protein [Sinorhizobium meliloti]